ncbi:MAG: M3 family oligoendopeptidase [Oscillospiraceae bacterium]|nr:M3 family oligoendopeptidase [Oscillospiraceae bacterium]
MTKFSEMQYERPNLDELKESMRKLTGRLQMAKTYGEARAAFLEKDNLSRHIDTLMELVTIRHSVDTRDAFYADEQDFWNAAVPELEEYLQEWTLAMLQSPFRADFAEEYGNLMFLNAEISLKTFLPDEVFISAMKEENDVSNAYEKLLASAAIPFEGGVYTLSQLTPFKSDPDDDRRLNAWKAEGQWYKEHQAELDGFYDQLVHLRDRLGRMLGYDGYTTLGYYRMGRNCYTKEDVEVFRTSVVKYVVPVAEQVFRRQAERLGKEYPMNYADNALEFRSGNPRPAGSPEEILAAARDFYNELSSETGVFFRTMLEGELLDVLSTEGKQAGGYCTGIPEYEVPFIFANFNGTQGDIEVVTHEAGHAFAAWMNRKRIPVECIWPSMEACEVHSMSMEFFAEPWADCFFGRDAQKFLYSHLSGALTFIPYGTMVDHFQHIVYEKPDLTPAQRHAVWKELSGIYLPWMKLDGEIPFYAEGEAWQRQHHIYSSPFYYIDYCLAQTVALQFWKLIQEDRENAWRHYMAYTKQGGSRTFTDLLEHAGLQSPFEEECLRSACEKAAAWLEQFDASSLC